MITINMHEAKSSTGDSKDTTINIIPSKDMEQLLLALRTFLQLGCELIKEASAENKQNKRRGL